MSDGMNPQDILGTARRGYFYDDLGQELQKVVPAAMNLQKPGSVTITLKIEPEDGETCKFSATIASKIPVSNGGTTTMYATPKGSLTKTDPRQRDMGEVVQIEKSVKPIKEAGATRKPIG